MGGKIPEYHEFLSFLTIYHSLNDFNMIYRQNIPINREKGQKNRKNGRILLVSKENHKLQFAFNSCPERVQNAPQRALDTN